MKRWLKVRDGHVWCTRHGQWWKECDCPGDVSAKMTITHEVMEACAPLENALARALELVRGSGCV